MGANIPKQFLELNGKPVLAHTLGLYQDHPLVDGIVLVVAPVYFEECRALAARHGITKPLMLAESGESAQDSIYSGLKAAAAAYPSDTVVLLHDGVRPYVLPEVITANIEAVEQFGNAVTYPPCYETIVLSKDGSTINAMPYRKESYTAQAPQSFRLGDILKAHEQYGNDAMRQAMDLVADVRALWAGGEMEEEDMDEIMRALQEAYWEAKKKTRAAKGDSHE